jgi:hypothetical protein
MTHQQNASFVLRSGREIWLAASSHAMAYAGLIEGLPHREMNDSIIARALRDAEGRCLTCIKGGAKPLLIPPPRSPLPQKPDYEPTPEDVQEFLQEVEGGYSKRLLEQYGPPEFLPPWQYLGTFKSAAMAPAAGTASWLTVVWFQVKYGPMWEPVRDQLRELDWESVAVDIVL